MRKYTIILIILCIITLINLSIFHHLQNDLAAKDRQIKQHNREILILKKILAPAPKIERHIKANSKLDQATAHDVTAGIIIESNRNNLDPEFVTAIATKESHFDQLAKSEAGACGLMQLMPIVWNAYGEGNVWSWRDNLAAGCKYLADLTKRFGGQNELILASFNAGPSRSPREILRAAGSYPGKVNRGYRRLKYGQRD